MAYGGAAVGVVLRGGLSHGPGIILATEGGGVVAGGYGEEGLRVPERVRADLCVKGEIEGEIKLKVADVITVLEARGREVPTEVRERVLASTDLTELDRWIRRAAMASDASELFATTAS